MSFWRGFVDDFFTTNAIMKLGLVDHDTQQRNEFGKEQISERGMNID